MHYLVKEAGQEGEVAVEQRPLALGPVVQSKGAQPKVGRDGVTASERHLHDGPHFAVKGETEVTSEGHLPDVVYGALTATKVRVCGGG